jgi:hypothetical protein
MPTTLDESDRDRVMSRYVAELRRRQYLQLEVPISKWMVLGLLLLLCACDGSGPRSTPTPTPLANRDAIASSVAAAFDSSQEKHNSPMRASFGQIIPVASYGDTLLLHVIPNGLGTDKAGLFALLGASDAVNELATEIAQLSDVTWMQISFGSTEAEKLFTKIIDLQAFARGEITAEQLRQRTVFP